MNSPKHMRHNCLTKRFWPERRRIIMRMSPEAARSMTGTNEKVHPKWDTIFWRIIAKDFFQTNGPRP